MSEYGEHFIREIEIKNYKLFKDFKAKGFGRVNLIGGKNNVGKTAFMEACYLLTSNKIEFDLFDKLFEIKTSRNIINMLMTETNQKENIKNLIKDTLDLEIIKKHNNDIAPKSVAIKLIMPYIVVHNGYGLLSNFINYKSNELSLKLLDVAPFAPKKYNYDNLMNSLNIHFDLKKIKYSKNFIFPLMFNNSTLEDIISQTKLDGKYKKLNEIILDIFNISSIDIIKNKPMLRADNEWRELSEFGEGIKNFINIIASILISNSECIFIDEIENGIHYTNFDKLWEIILKITKEQNVQVFATTHSKECIESYARVAKKLEDDEIGFIELGRNKEDKIRAVMMDSQRFFRELEANNEVRGW